MEKVLMSVNFGKFKKTKFTSVSEARDVVRKNKIPNVRLKQKLSVSIEESWDNF